MSTITGLIILCVMITGLLIFFANKSYEKKLKVELNTLNLEKDLKNTIIEETKIIPLNSRFDAEEQASPLTTNDFVRKELTPHIKEVVSRSSKKRLVKTVKKK